MSVIPRIPTANESPDTTNGIGGDIAVTTPSNTGHASTVVSVIDTFEIKTCRWFTFQNLLVGNRTSVKLKVTHTSSGDINVGVTSNLFLLQYTIDGGSNWIDIVNRADFETLEGPTIADINLSLTQDLTQVQVRDRIQANSILGDPASCTATISDIKIEVIVADVPMLD